MCGFLQSILVSVPVSVTRSLKSKRADMLWCAEADPAVSSTAIAMNRPAFLYIGPSFWVRNTVVIAKSSPISIAVPAIVGGQSPHARAGGHLTRQDWQLSNDFAAKV